MKSTETFSDDCVVVAVNDQLTCDLAGEAAVLHLPDGVYYGLNETGAFLWERLRSPVRVADLRAALLAEFEVTETVADRDLNALLNELTKAGLIEVRRANSAES